MRQSSNRNQIRLTVILSAEDNDILVNASNEVGLKKSEFLRAIIQGIGLGSKMAQQVESKENVNLELGGYGLNIPINVMEELLQDVSEKLMKSVEISELRPKKELRYKRMKQATKVA